MDCVEMLLKGLGTKVCCIVVANKDRHRKVNFRIYAYILLTFIFIKIIIIIIVTVTKKLFSLYKYKVLL
jgi:hypothetical protein